MEPGTAIIPVRARRQAMDWSLVLVSQGIESRIEFAEDGGGWHLMVSAPDLDRALEAIRLYQLENRRWTWRRELFQPGLLFDWASLAWVLLLAVFFWLSEYRIDLRTAGLMDSTGVSHGQWWRLFTAVWLHADASHLAENATIGVVLLGLVMGRFGTGAGLLAAYLAGAGGNLLVWLFAPKPHYSLGASGMVMGALGILAAQSVPLWRQVPEQRKHILSGVVGGLMLFVLLGLSPGSDVVAHFGGFVSGLALGAVLALVPSIAQRPKTNLPSGFVFWLMVIWPWWLALRPG
ncbi:MAG TPA: rhomboid family intramembrane serine protease [Candidatus Binatia bacterium]|nr:rhomboid family intramembrane serine protease [Candidatus Binatia bacterium]